jgi:hypothetical protein
MASGVGKTKAASALIVSLNVERLVGTPFAKYVGNKMNVFGNWWPGTKGKDANKEYGDQVVSVDEHHIPSGCGPGTKGTLHFQIALIDQGDPNSCWWRAFRCWWVRRCRRERRGVMRH